VRWEDDVNDVVPRELPLQLVAKNEKPKVVKKLEEVKEVDYEREELIHYAMTVTGVIDQEIISEALSKVFGKEPLNAKVIHKNVQKILDAVETIEKQRSIVLVEGLQEETKIPKEEFEYKPYTGENKILEEEKVINNKGSSHVQYVLNEDGNMIIAPGPNKKCHCGSGERYKRCCMVLDKNRMIKAEHAEKEKEEDNKPEAQQSLFI
jgi:hypothetical protein